MLFPIILVVLFFSTLIFNHRVLYAPSDYNNEDNFLEAAKGRRQLDDNFEKLEAEVNAISKTLQSSLPSSSETLDQAQIDDFKIAITHEFASLKARFEATRESADDLILNALPQSALQANVIEHIFAAKKPVTLAELSTALSMSEAAINKAAKKMVERGAIHMIDYDGSQAYVQASL